MARPPAGPLPVRWGHVRGRERARRRCGRRHPFFLRILLPCEHREGSENRGGVQVVQADMPSASLQGNRGTRWGQRRAADALRAQAPWLCGVTGRTVLQHWDTVLRLAPPDALPPPAVAAAAAAAAAAAVAAPPAAPPAAAGEAPESPGGVQALDPAGGAPPAALQPAGAARTAARKRGREAGPPAGAGVAPGESGGGGAGGPGRRDGTGGGRRGGRAARVGARSAAEEAVLSSDSDLDEYIRPPAEVACLRLLGL